jgi:hypothetical protein
MYKRRLQKIISNIYNSDKNIIITGARQTGKSTLLEVLLADSLYKDNFSYISFDNPDIREFFSSNAVEKLSAENKEVLILDEVQKFPKIFDSIKVLIDKNKKNHHFLTGSSQLMLLKSVQESLAGRVSLFAMYPLAFSELFDDRTEIFLDKIFEKGWDKNIPTLSLSQKNIADKAIIRHQYWGGYPEVINSKDLSRKQRWLVNYKNTYLEKDVRDLRGSIELEKIAKFLNIIADRTAQIYSYSEVARDCGISVTSANNYTKLLQISYQIQLLQPYYLNVSKRLIKAPKMYFLDTGLLRIILKNTERDLTGKEYETWVFSELIKWQSVKNIQPELYYYRTSAGLEIDFIIKYKNKVLPIEVKMKEKINGVDVKSLKLFMEQYNLDFGIVVYRGDNVENITKNILAIPDKILFL